MKLQPFDSNYFHVKSHFEDGGTQNYLVFLPVPMHFKTVKQLILVKLQCEKKKRLLDENIKLKSMSDNSHNPGISYFDNAKIRAKFVGTCLKLENLMFTHN